MKEDEALDQALAEAIPQGSERVLVVDDDKSQAESLRALLARLGYDAALETDSLRALELIRDSPDVFDLLVTDQIMPNMIGTTLAAEARRIRRDLPVILCTGCADKINEGTAASRGIRELVLKPYTIRDMASAVRRALDGRAE